MITEQRKQYIKDWKIKNIDKIRAYQRGYYKNNIHKPYYSGRKRPATKASENYKGTSGLGRKYELIAAKLLPNSKLSFSFKHPFDLVWDGKTIDVKMRNKNKKGAYLFTRKKTCTADYFLCFCVDKNIEHILLIPSKVYKNSIRISDKKIKTVLKRYIFTVHNSI